MANHDVRLSSDRFTKVVQDCGFRAACVYNFLVAWTFVEIQDPSDPKKRLGIVRLGGDSDAVYVMSHKQMAEATGNVLSKNAFQKGCDELIQAHFVIQHLKQHGQYLLIRDSQKMMFKTYIVRPAYPRYPWIFEIEEFKAFRRSSDLEIQDILPINKVREKCVPETQKGKPEVERGEPERKKGEPEGSGHLKNEQLTPLGFNEDMNKEGKRTEAQQHSPSFGSKDNGQSRPDLYRGGDQDISFAELRKHPEYSRAARTVKQIIARAASSGSVNFSHKNKLILLDGILEDSDLLKWEFDVWLFALNQLLHDLANKDSDGFALRNGASYIATTLVPALLGDGRSSSVVDDYFEHLAEPFVIEYLTNQGQAEARAELAKRRELDAEEAALIEETLPG